MRPSCTKFWLSFLLLSLLSLLPVHALDKFVKDPAITYLNVGAQFRGGIKKHFPDVGCGMTFSKAQESSVLGAMLITVAHPQKKEEKYTADVALEYQVNNNKFTVSKVMRQNITGFDEEDQDDILNALCILSHVGRTDFAGRTKEVWDVAQSKYNVTIREKKTKGFPGFEIDLVQIDGEIDVKFFIYREPGKSENTLWKFRLKDGKIVSTFELCGYDEMEGKYKGKEFFGGYF